MLILFHEFFGIDAFDQFILLLDYVHIPTSDKSGGQTHNKGLQIPVYIREVTSHLGVFDGNLMLDVYTH